MIWLDVLFVVAMLTWAAMLAWDSYEIRQLRKLLERDEVNDD